MNGDASFTENDKRRFFRFVGPCPTSGCWQWNGQIASGYGRFWLAGRDAMAHRVSYEWLIGPIPDGLQLDHLCRNRACVNPDHLDVVTSHENTLRGVRARSGNSLWKNAPRTHCKYGHEFTFENTRVYVGPDGRPHRQCRACDRDRYRRDPKKANTKRMRRKRAAAIKTASPKATPSPFATRNDSREKV